jgi:hypothetical protein
MKRAIIIDTKADFPIRGCIRALTVVESSPVGWRGRETGQSQGVNGQKYH